MYADLDEFVHETLGLSNPTAGQLGTATRCLESSTAEIDSYLDAPTSWTFAAASADQQALVTAVCMERASEYWRSPADGVLPSGPDSVPVLTARNSFKRHALKLQPLKMVLGAG